LIIAIVATTAAKAAMMMRTRVVTGICISA
jgi:hypothetical protein